MKGFIVSILSLENNCVGCFSLCFALIPAFTLGPFCLRKYLIEAKYAEKRQQRSPPIKEEVKERVSGAASCVSVQVREKEKHFCHLECCQSTRPRSSRWTHKYYANLQTVHGMLTYTLTMACLTPPPQWRLSVCVSSLVFMHIHNFLIQQVCKRVFVGSVLPFAPARDKLVLVTSPQTAASAQVETNPLSAS